MKFWRRKWAPKKAQCLKITKYCRMRLFVMIFQHCALWYPRRQILKNQVFDWQRRNREATGLWRAEQKKKLRLLACAAVQDYEPIKTRVYGPRLFSVAQNATPFRTAVVRNLQAVTDSSAHHNPGEALTEIYFILTWQQWKYTGKSRIISY